MKTELDAAEGVNAVEETKEQIKEETAPKLQPKLYQINAVGIKEEELQM